MFNNLEGFALPLGLVVTGLLIWFVAQVDPELGAYGIVLLTLAVVTFGAWLGGHTGLSKTIRKRRRRTTKQ